MQFQVLQKDISSKARVGNLITMHGNVETPVFMPVATRGAIRALTLKDIEEIGFDIILSNTYHLYIRPGINIIKKSEGVHNFINYHKPILTDSGGFQVFSLSDLCKIYENGVEFRSHLDGSKHFFSPERVLDVQKVLGSDIMMVLDQCIEYPSTIERARDAVYKTINWAIDSNDYWHREFDIGRQALFAIVQGSVYKELREECAQRLIELDFSGYAIGGLSVGEPNDLYREMTRFTLGCLPEKKPMYMMGIGSPMEILYAVMYGADMFDCVMPTRIARNGTLYTSNGRINIKSSIYTEDFSPLDENCNCYVCRSFTRAYLRHIYRIGEITSMIYNTYHNLFFMKNFMTEIRQSIKDGSFVKLYRRWESVYGDRTQE
ncbi:MAG: tRNA guanosine(34) transglycosylase Tgt [Spirochaetota bacterium]|nr:tRNA guanosine(34) transglycosylase Tgt [Spirochaetota bacterium]